MPELFAAAGQQFISLLQCGQLHFQTLKFADDGFAFHDGNLLYRPIDVNRIQTQFPA
jgi:hypothetical protein